MKQKLIQFCHSVINPIMGCLGCELWPTPGRILHHLVEYIAAHTALPRVVCYDRVVLIAGKLTTSALHEHRVDLTQRIAAALQLDPAVRNGLVDVIHHDCKCYAGLVGTARAGHPDYAEQFESPKLFPGRMLVAAHWDPPTAAENADKPWLVGMPRLILIGNMGDAFSGSVPSEFLEAEIINNVASDAGQRHLWLWQTNRPDQMAKFGEQLHAHNIRWPVNLVAMTTVTNRRTASRIEALRRVPAPIKALSVSPLFESVSLCLEGINWVVVGGGSDTRAETFHVSWALEVEQQCCAQGAAFFLNRLGRNPDFNGPVKLNDPHGCDWTEWPEACRLRRLPEAFVRYVGHRTFNSTHHSTN